MARPAIGRGAATLAVFLLPLGGAVPSALSASTARVAYGLDVVRLESARLALVGLSASPTRTKVPPARLLVSASFGGRFADISPRLAPATHVDDVQFLDRKHGWVVIYNLDTVGVTVYRTSDGGRTWKSTAAGSHSMAAGSVATVQFLTRRRGWLVQQNPTGPVAYLLGSTDGGARWHEIAALPEVAPVEFVSPTEAWQAGGEFSLRLFHSSDGGRRWRRVRVPIPPHERMAHVFYGSLAFFGHEILAPVTFVRGRDAELDVYRSTDDGRRWRRVDGAVAACPLPDVQAVSAGSAWVMLRTAHDFALYATSDAGAHWHPLHPTAHP